MDQIIKYLSELPDWAYYAAAAAIVLRYAQLAGWPARAWGLLKKIRLPHFAPDNIIAGGDHEQRCFEALQLLLRDIEEHETTERHTRALKRLADGFMTRYWIEEE